MKNTETAIATVNSTFDLCPIDPDTRDMIAEELDGLGSLSFDSVKIPSGGGLAFEIAGDDPDNPEMVQELVGVIVHHHPASAYWAQAFGSGESNSPDCASSDGKVGVMRETGEIRDCATCPYNQYGSAGAGKACKNTHHVYLLREGEMLPVLLTLPPTSIGNFRDYLAKRLVLKGIRANAAVTKVKLTREKNPQGILYSKAVFSFGGKLSPELEQAIKPTSEAIKEMVKKAPAVQANPAGQVVYDAENPFY